ncbi:MAG: hypothetical protein KAH96_01325 [Alphaproteobacteria bacterium]|nr:hypothetical protein [Alphaproteobacteria bacterium]
MHLQKTYTTVMPASARASRRQSCRLMSHETRGRAPRPQHKAGVTDCFD